MLDHRPSLTLSHERRGRQRQTEIGVLTICSWTQRDSEWELCIQVDIGNGLACLVCHMAERGGEGRLDLFRKGSEVARNVRFVLSA